MLVSPGRWVVFGGGAGGGLLAGADVAAEAGQVLMAGLGLQLRCGASGFGKMSQRPVAGLVRRPPLPVRVQVDSGGLGQVLGAGGGTGGR